MEGTLGNNVNSVLRTLAESPRDEAGYAWLPGQQLQESTGLPPQAINDAVAILEESGLVEVQRFLGTAPYLFGFVSLTARGRYEWERLKSIEQAQEVSLTRMVRPTAIRPPIPIGSPFGFTDIDWEIVAEARSKSDQIFVVLGYAFQSQHYDNEKLKENVKKMFEQAVATYTRILGAIPVKLTFRALAAGYGEHLFNEIARDIISADVAVFETSDLNPNVMLEMGVALTWGVRVLPIKEEKCPKPPSDISGQTWADYRDNAREFVVPDHMEKLVAMIDRAARKKIARL